MIDGRIWAVVLARVGSGAKSRLGGMLTAQQRSQLALTMLSAVLTTCADLVKVVAVVDTPAARRLAQRAGAVVVDDPLTGDMNAAAAAGVEAARRHGATTVIVLPGDVPLISHADLEALLSAAGDASRAVVIGASRDGQGTNALLLRPADIIAPAFGPPSVDRHAHRGQAAGARVETLHGLDLALDVDTPTDLADLQTERARTLIRF